MLPTITPTINNKKGKKEEKYIVTLKFRKYVHLKKISDLKTQFFN